MSDETLGRRDLARLGAAIALAGLGEACTRAPRERIVPYVSSPRDVTPGKARAYATASTRDGYATGLLVESHEGRPTKIEGNPDHPASLGATGPFEQASVLSLYDPRRARGVTERGTPASPRRVTEALAAGRWTTARGDGLHVVLGPTSSPTLAAILAGVRERLPRAGIWFHSVGIDANGWEGARIAFGRVLEPRFDLHGADVIVALDADFLTRGPAALALSRAFAARRTPADMNRLYAIEPLVTVTGASADHRLAVRAADVLAIAAALAAELHATDAPPSLLRAAEPHAAFVRAVARDLTAHRGASLVVAGADQPPIVHALAHAINDALGNLGKTVTLAPSPIVEAGEPSHDRARLRDALSGEVDTLVVCDENLAYLAPDLAPLLGRARQSAMLAAFDDETSRAATFTIAEAHELESWGDARAFDGTISVIQPLVAPLFGGRTAIDVLAPFAGRDAGAYDLVKARFADERAFRRALRRGVEEGTAIPTVTPRVDRAAVEGRLARDAAAQRPPEIELVARVDPRMHDGRFADNAWLLELPQPMTSLTWTNAATLSPKTARDHEVEDGDEIELARDGAAVRAPVCVVPGQADGTVGLTLGWGRRDGPPIARGRGADAYALGRSAAPPALKKTGERRDLPRTQRHHGLEGRDDEIARHTTLREHREHPPPPHKRSLTLYEKKPNAPKQWAMAIDLSKCTGCSACVVACQAENNVPTVGADGVVMGRAMHWLRVDAYVAEEGPVMQPMLCQHCEKAPCEYVCPVNATVHSPDGLNEMVYNRCVGTRFCSNNCPYKVRRFNWFDYHRKEDRTEQLVHNPDVTVRERGVMEKCTFCVQRIREHEIAEARGEHPPRPRTACEQACPTGAIVFGDREDRASDVARLHADPRAYAALGDLGTEPRVRYLTRIRNTNPEVA